MKINEIFYSLQGEGARSGEASIFIRLTGCDLACNFCDTEFESGNDMSNEALLAYIKRFAGHWITWTGGEPMLQLTEADIDFFHKAGYKQSVESNGNHPLPGILDWRVISPKVAEHVLKKHNPNGVDELRYVRHKGQMAVPEPAIEAKYYFLSPIFDGATPNMENVRHCINLCLKNPKWRLSLQTHKLMRIL